MVIDIIKAEEQHACLLPGIERSAGESFLHVPGYEWIASDDVMTVGAHLKLIHKGTVWVARGADDHLWGFLSAEAFEDALHIWEISVHRDAQRQGVGRKLMSAAEGFAAQQGLKALSLTTFREVSFNAPYYARLGYEVLESAALDARLRAVLADEAAAGLSADSRCAMIKHL